MTRQPRRRSTSPNHGLTRRRFLVRAAQCAGVLGVGIPTRLIAAPAVKSEASITYWTFLNPKAVGPREDAMRQVHDAFAKTYPNINLAVEVMPLNLMDQQLLKAAASGKGPDVMRVIIEELDTHVNAGSILPLDDWVTGWSAKRKQDCVLPWSWTVRNGKKFAIPLEYRGQPLVYRKDFLERAGLDVPRTWDELARVSAALTTDKLTGFIVGMNPKDRGATLMQWLFSAYAAVGGEIVGKDGNAKFNSTEGVRVFQFLLDLVDKHKMPKDCLNWGADEVMMGLKGSTLAMTVMGSHRVSTARIGRGVGQNLQTALIPHATDRNKQTPTYVYGWTNAMCATSKNRDAAWKFIEFWSRAESQAINARVGGELPATASAYDDPWFKTAEAGEMLRWRGWMTKDPIIFNPYPKHYPDLGDILTGAASNIIGAHRPIRESLDEAAHTYNNL